MNIPASSNGRSERRAKRVAWAWILLPFGYWVLLVGTSLLAKYTQYDCTDFFTSIYGQYLTEFMSKAWLVGAIALSIEIPLHHHARTSFDEEVGGSLKEKIAYLESTSVDKIAESRIPGIAIKALRHAHAIDNIGVTHKVTIGLAFSDGKAVAVTRENFEIKNLDNVRPVRLEYAQPVDGVITSIDGIPHPDGDDEAPVNINIIAGGKSAIESDHPRYVGGLPLTIAFSPKFLTSLLEFNITLPAGMDARCVAPPPYIPILSSSRDDKDPQLVANNLSRRIIRCEVPLIPHILFSIVFEEVHAATLANREEIPVATGIEDPPPEIKPTD